MAESSIGAESFLPLSPPEAASYPALLRFVLNGVSFRVRHHNRLQPCDRTRGFQGHDEGQLATGLLGCHRQCLWVYWLLRTSVRERGPLGFHRPPLFRGQVALSHRNCGGMVLMDQRKQVWLGSRPSGKACTGCMRGLPKTFSDTTLRAG
jgi:hypothetical protein